MHICVFCCITSKIFVMVVTYAAVEVCTFVFYWTLCVWYFSDNFPFDLYIVTDGLFCDLCKEFHKNYHSVRHAM